MAKYELSLYRDLWLWIRGETLLPAGAQALPHPPGRLQILGFVTAVLVVEMVVVHLILPTGVVRVVALLLSLWAIIFVWGLIAAERIRPSYISDDVTVLRRGRTVFAEIPTAIVQNKSVDRSFASEIEIRDGELTVGGPAGTDTLLQLSAPVMATPDRYPWQRPQPMEVDRVRFFSAAREH
ncbi:hypothetical protein M5J06_02315 [Corynebacterium sp. B5-R-101]|uniref:DUF304 domain-containing protein n=1 Tax=Corynebacterium intestinale TaxID=2943492 RepID=A0ABT0T8S7_9CORY|nr:MULTISPECIES: hypothetical protein [Corynebacterium]MCL8492978.1 hypothetical protein [Corynebacterium intestinale]MCP1389210.1 hypothetical protein [Corynebacterium intestinale]MDK8897996.1 hypothetical protein [Corynebacterium sp. MSK004]